jgi:hypothetical protein
MAPSYVTNNVLLQQTNLVTGNGPWPATFATPGTYGALSFLCAAAPGFVTNRIIIQHVDNTLNEVKTVGIPDWNSTGTVAWDANGAIILDSRTFTNLYAGVPGLFVIDVTVNSGSPITNLNVSFFRGAAGSHSAIFAVSGATSSGGPFIPITLTQSSYNRDLIIESNAPPANSGGPYVSAFMDGAGNAWYERGFLATSPSSGLPGAGATFATNLSGVNYQYMMAPSYTNENALLITAGIPHANLALTTPVAYSALSFLTSAGDANANPPQINATVYHQDGTTEAGTFYSNDWFNNTNAVWIANGRVNGNTLIPGDVGSGNPRLYARDIAVANTSSPVTNVDFDLLGGSGSAAIFAISGVVANAVNIPPFRITAAQFLPGNQFEITWVSVAGQNYFIESKDSLSAPSWTTNASMVAVGSSSSYTNTGLGAIPRRFYRVVATP